MSELPGDLLYTNEHEWLRREEDGSMTIGVTDHAQSALGDLVYVELPEVGQTVEAGGEMASLARQASEPLPGDWRAYSLPLYQDGDLTAARLLVRHRGADDAGGLADGERGGRRFLIDVELSRLGPLQLDGMLKTPRLDLVLRSHRPFPIEDRQEIGRLFADACDACGLAGALSFQPGGLGWVQVARSRGGGATDRYSA